MMKPLKSFLLYALLFCLVPQASADNDDYYVNPVISTSLPDPTIVKASDGYFYLYATEDIRNVPIYRSKDLCNWKYVTTAFNSYSRPKFVQGAGIWAPDINYVDGKYLLYYSMSTWGGEWTCGIGVATASKPQGPFTDKGKLFISSEIGVQNSIDPFFIEEEDGRKYLFWGSFRGIYGIELSADGLSVKEGAKPVQIAGTLTEGTYILKRNGYYYLIGSAGSCCEGANSSYHMLVARSKDLFGPYTSKSGGKAMDNQFSDFLLRSSAVIGPGHCSEIVQDDAGQDWIMYHGYTADDPDNGRVTFLDRVQWDEKGWPYINGTQSSVISDCPIFGDKEEDTYTKVEYVDFAGDDLQNTFFYESGYVPSSNTRIEVKCQPYAENDNGEPSTGRWRAIFYARKSNQDGISLYQNDKGGQWGYFVGGYVNDNIGLLKAGVDYEVSADLASLTINGKKYKTNRTSYNATTARLRLFSGREDYPFFGRIYGLKVYEGDELLHNYEPALRDRDEIVGFLDSVTGDFLLPHVYDAFGNGEAVVDDIRDIEVEGSAASLWNVAGQTVSPSSAASGIYVDGKRKVLILSR